MKGGFYTAMYNKYIANRGFDRLSREKQQQRQSEELAEKTEGFSWERKLEAAKQRRATRGRY